VLRPDGAPAEKNLFEEDTGELDCPHLRNQECKT